jgi:aflatoxin B1 aldehyde reductase
MEKLRSTPEVIFGCSSFCDVPAPHAQARFTSPETALPVLNLLRDKGVRFLDTARGYPVGAAGGSERLLGNLGVGQRGFTIDTKVQSWAPGSHTAEKVAKSIDASLDALEMPKVHVMYLHSPDRATPFEITCHAMDKAYREGKFQKFGISNYTAEEVKQIVDICEKEGLVKPSVYQGRYNALVRSGEEALFPLLRKHKMSFYAYRYVSTNPAFLSREFLLICWEQKPFRCWSVLRKCHKRFDSSSWIPMGHHGKFSSFSFPPLNR